MFGGASFGSLLFGGIVAASAVIASSERASEVLTQLDSASERSSELIGSNFIEQPVDYRIIVKDQNGNALGEFDNFRAFNKSCFRSTASVLNVFGII